MSGFSRTVSHRYDRDGADVELDLPGRPASSGPPATGSAG